LSLGKVVEYDKDSHDLLIIPDKWHEVFRFEFHGEDGFRTPVEGGLKRRDAASTILRAC
jgi:hypothetical protein